jgi:ppGpp synthetase/RelA/SpoT-type nucleotidyltranferase
MAERTIEDRLREEYFDLLPTIRKVAEQLEAEVKFHTLPISQKLNKHERLVVTSRIKDCDSALESLRRRQMGNIFNSDTPDIYTLLNLRDLAGVRVLAFPPSRLKNIASHLRTHFPDWNPDHILDLNGTTLAYKYYGYCNTSSNQVCGEYQITSILTGRFWEVEHSAIYKPSPELHGVARSLEMKDRTAEVYKALRDFEDEFERLLHEDGFKRLIESDQT